jgi:maltooligosyltrehalose trehalohydrolase
VLDWNAREAPRGREWMAHTRSLLATRTKEIAPRLAQSAFAWARWEQDVLTAAWRLGGEAQLNLIGNISAAEAARPEEISIERPIWGGAVPEILPPWSVYWGIGAA